MVKKNDIIDLTIEDLGVNGEGIGKVDGYTLFVKDAVIGDKVTVKVMKANKNFGFARLMEIKEPSKDRVLPRCNVARQCGGCQIQCINYKEQLRFKKNKVYNNLVRIGGQSDFVMNEVIGMDEPFNYRNKSQFPIGTDKEGNIISGFFAGRTHSIINIESCDLGLKIDGRDVNREVMDVVKAFMVQYGIKPYNEVTHKGLVRHVLIRIGAKTKQIMVCIIINGKNLPNEEKLTEELCKLEGMYSISLNINTKKSNVILGDKVINLYGPGYIEDYIGDVKFRISPLSFFQVNPVQTEKLYGKAIEYAGLTGKEKVLDAYCGTGTIGLIASDHAKEVIGVELNRDAVKDAVINARQNQISNIQFYQNDAGVFMTELAEKNEKIDVVFMDPPRSGCSEEFLTSLLRLSPRKVIYVSCNPETLVRDLQFLTKHGYRMEKGVGVDMFPMTVHVESVVLMQYCGK